MGVYRLESFYESNCKPALVKIQTLLDEYRTETGYVETATVVVDGTNCLRHLYGDLDWVCGGQMKEYKEKAQKVVDKFKELNVKLVFFFDGPTVEQKRPKWIERRLKTVEDSRKILSTLSRFGSSTSLTLVKDMFMLPPGLGNVARFFFKLVYGCEVHISVKENDEEIAEYARKNNSFGILAQDTDFIILKGAKYYLSMKKFNFDTMETIVYDSNKLVEYLDIKADYLPLFATLCGNDIVSRDLLQNWHLQITKKNHYNAPAEVATYIRGLEIEGDTISEETFKKISTDVFGDEEKVDLIKTSIEGYSTTPTTEDNLLIDEIINGYESDNNWKDILTLGLERHRGGLTSAHVWAILSGAPFELSAAIEDFSRDDLPAAATYLTRLRQRIYGILLHEKPLPEGEQYHHVQEWCVDRNFKKSQSAVSIEALPPTVDHPGLLALWKNPADSEDFVETEENAVINSARWNLFVRSISKNIDVKEIRSLDKTLVVPALVLKYMYENLNTFYEFEIKALIALALRMKTVTTEELAKIYVNRVNERAIRLATLYMRAHGIMLILLTSLAGPIPLKEAMPWVSFDGKLFQNIYDKAKNRANEKVLCNHNEETAKQLSEILKFVLPLQRPRNY